jgi:hypothetical protein
VTLAEARSVIEQSFPRQAPRVRYVELKASTITIDDLGVDPQIVKLDIQGNELAALKGATRTLTTSSPDLLVEITVAEVSLIGYLESFGYRPYIYTHSTGTFALHLEAGTAPSRNVFFSKRNLAARVP